MERDLKVLGVKRLRELVIEKNGEVLFDRPKPTAGCSANGRIYTGCTRRNVPDFGRVFLMSKYTDITQNTYIQS